MPIYQTGGYRVKPSAVEKIKQAIKDCVAYVQANEPRDTHVSSRNSAGTVMIDQLYAQRPALYELN